MYSILLGQLDTHGNMKTFQTISRSGVINQLCWHPSDKGTLGLVGENKYVEIWDVRGKGMSMGMGMSMDMYMGMGMSMGMSMGMDMDMDIHTTYMYMLQLNLTVYYSDMYRNYWFICFCHIGNCAANKITSIGSNLNAAWSPDGNYISLGNKVHPRFRCCCMMNVFY